MLGRRQLLVACRRSLLAACAATVVLVDAATPVSRGLSASDTLALRAKSVDSTSRHRSGGQSLKPKAAGWFDSFSQGESTYAEGVTETSPDFPLYKVLDGWNPNIGGGSQGGVPAKVFHESPSAAWVQSWQTNYPSLDSGIASSGGQPNGAWYQGAGGSWNQEYKTAQPGGGTKSAAWFDSQVNQIDGFGRPKEPYLGAGDRYWWAQEVAVNTTLTCPDQGCVANTTLQAFDGLTLSALRCSMSLAVHATDFDEEYSSETVEWIIVNGQTVSSNCKPGMNGCATENAFPLYPCVTEMDITNLLTWTGTLQIAAKISDTVDECPYEGNLLSAVPTVTCLVIPQNPSPMDGQSATMMNGEPASPIGVSGAAGAAGAAGAGSSDSDWVFGDASGSSQGYQGVTNGGNTLPDGLIPGQQIGQPGPDGEAYYPFGDLTSTVNSYMDCPNGNESDWNMQCKDEQAPGFTLGTMVGGDLFRAIAPLSCVDRGCKAYVMMKLNSTAVEFGQCFLSVFVNSTDFDNDDSQEVISYIGTETKNLTLNANPGKNPCKSADQGQPLAPAEMVYEALHQVEITSDCADGYLQLNAAISEYVDECASNGYLFNAIAQVDCQVKAGSYQTTPIPYSGLLQESAEVGLAANAGLGRHSIKPQLRGSA